jgi:hypothetical protein
MAAAILALFVYRSQYAGESPPNDYDQVSASFSNHLQQLSARNVSALVGGYQSNATVVFEGNAPGFIGSYKGADNLNVLFRSILGKYANYTTSFVLGNQTNRLTVSDDTALVNSSFDFAERGGLLGSLNATVIAQTSYIHQGSSWLISRESWNFTRFEMQYRIIT